jgi:hypothetical protein
MLKSNLTLEEAEASFFGIKQPKRSNVVLPEEIDTENVSWRDIRPDKQYNEVRKLFIQQQKKRKFEEYKKNNESAN